MCIRDRFSGFNSSIATTVWVGFDKPKSMGRGEAGGVAALPIWVDYMSTALEGVKENDLVLPEFIEEGFINRTTGKETTEDDPDATPEYFARAQQIINPIDGDDLNSNDLENGSSIDGETSDDLNNTLIENKDDSSEENLNDASYPLNNERIIETPEDTQGLF